MSGRIFVGDKPIGEIKSLREVLWAVFAYKGLECSFWERCQVAAFITRCWYMAWRCSKGIQDTLRAMAQAIETIKAEEKEHDF